MAIPITKYIGTGREKIWQKKGGEKMLGIIVAILYAGICFIGGTSLVVVYAGATNFLFYWYIVTSCIVGLIVGIAILIVLLGGTVVGTESGGVLGGLLGFLVGGAISVLILIVTCISRGLLIGGAYLLHTAYVAGGSFSDFDHTKLIFGGIMLSIGLIMSKFSGSSKASN